MTYSSNTTKVLDLTATMPSWIKEHTPAGVTEKLVQELSGSSWLLVDTNALAGNDETLALRMILERVASVGGSIALDVGWQPKHWGLAPGSPPTTGVLRRFRTLAEAAALLSCTDQEAEWFFHETDPVRIHETLPQRPAVLISDGIEPMRWCIGGHSGHVETIANRHAFLEHLLNGLSRHPELLGGAAPGRDAVADPHSLAELLRSAAEQKG